MTDKPVTDKPVTEQPVTEQRVTEQGTAPTAAQVYLVRHGETTWSASGRHTGASDLPLTEHGEAAAAALAATLAGVHFAAVFTSPLQRARWTAELAGFASAQVDPDLVEWDYGEQEGRTTAQIREQIPGWTLWRDGVTGGESAAQVGARVDRVLARVRAASGDVALFAHGHVLRVLAARWLGCPPGDGRYYALSTAAICVLGYEHETPVLTRWNVTVPVPDPPAAPRAGS